MSNKISESESDVIKNFIGTVLSYPAPPPKSAYEFEIRLRTVNPRNGKTTPGVSKEYFDTSIDNIKKSGIISTVNVEKTLVCKENVEDDERLITYLEPKKTKELVKKTQLRTHIIERLGVKMAISLERILPPKAKKYRYFKYRERVSMVSKDGYFRVDFTLVSENHTDNISECKMWLNNARQSPNVDKYEIEIELLDDVWFDLPTPQTLTKSLVEILRVLGVEKNISEFVEVCDRVEVWNDVQRAIKPQHAKHNNKPIRFGSIIQDVYSLRHQSLDHIRANPYFVTEKIDGERHVLYITSTTTHIIIKLIDNRDNCLVITKTPRNDAILHPRHLPLLIDGELVEISSTLHSLNELVSDISSQIKTPTTGFLINERHAPTRYEFIGFDVLMSNKSITSDKFETRRERLNSVSQGLSIIIDQARLMYSKLPLKYSAKLYLEYTPNNFETVINKAYPYTTDGAIFVPNTGYYTKDIYKWKPLLLTSIDFLIRIINDDESSKVLTIHLYVGIRRELFKKFNLHHDERWEDFFGPKYKNRDYIPVAFRPAGVDDAYVAKIKYSNVRQTTKREYQTLIGHQLFSDNQVLEMIYTESGEWVVLRRREDKTEKYIKGIGVGANDWRTAMGNWSIIRRPVTIAQLTESSSRYYLKSETSNELVGMRKFHNYIKRGLYDRYAKNIDNLLELGGGRVNDLHKWACNGVRHVVLIDMDQNGLDQGKGRWNEFGHKRGNCIRPSISFHQGDLSVQPIKKIIQQDYFNTELRKFFDVIAAQFSFHYFIPSVQALNRILNEVYVLLKTDGYFIITGMDGKLLFDYFQTHHIEYQQSLNIKDDDGNTQFKIKRLFKGTRLMGAGQEISVCIQSIGIPHIENLINFEYIISALIKNNRFSVVEDKYFKDIYPKFEESKGTKLTKAELEFSSFNRVVVFKKEFVKQSKPKKSRKKIIERK